MIRTVCLGLVLILHAAGSAFGQDAGTGRIDSDSLREEGIALIGEGRTAEAMDLLGRYLESQPNDDEVRWQIGVIHYNAENLDAAAECFKRIVDSDPDAPNHNALFMLGNVAFRKFELGDALGHYERLQRIEPGYPGLRENILLLKERIGRVRTLRDLRLRGDRFFWGALVGAGGLLLAGFVIEIRRSIAAG